MVQEAHLRLFEYQRCTRVRDVDSLLRRMIINMSINRFHRVLSAPFAFESIDKLDRKGMLIDPATRPEETFAAEQQLCCVAGLLSAKSRRGCQIFLAQRGGYSHEEIAIAFGIKPRTVEKHVVLTTSILKASGAWRKL